MKRLLCALLYLFTCSHQLIYIIPYPEGDPQLVFQHRIWSRVKEKLEEGGYELRVTADAQNLEEFAALISITNIKPPILNAVAAYPREKCWLISFEPPVYLPKIHDQALISLFGKIFVMFDDLVDQKHYFKFFFPQPCLIMDMRRTPFQEKRLCAMIAQNKKSSHPSELYSERQKVMAFFADKEGFDLYGRGWEGCPQWRGFAQSKRTTLEKYRFSICYENMKDQQGYISEKIFDCFVAGCVPIYLGASNIDEYIPKDCFIDRRDFSSEEELFAFLNGIDEEKHQRYIDAIQAFLASEQAEQFSIDAFVRLIKHSLEK